MHFAKEVAQLLDIPLHALPSEAEEQQLYAIGYQLYESGDYARAVHYFTKLVLTEPYLQKNWRGLASCRQMLKEYDRATYAWAIVAFLEEEDPLPHFHAAECLFSLNNKEDGLKALYAALALINNASQQAHLKDKINMLKQVHSNGTLCS